MKRVRGERASRLGAVRRRGQTHACCAVVARAHGCRRWNGSRCCCCCRRGRGRGRGEGRSGGVLMETWSRGGQDASGWKPGGEEEKQRGRNGKRGYGEVGWAQSDDAPTRHGQKRLTVLSPPFACRAQAARRRHSSRWHSTNGMRWHCTVLALISSLPRCSPSMVTCISRRHGMPAPRPQLKQNMRPRPRCCTSRRAAPST